VFMGRVYQFRPVNLAVPEGGIHSGFGALDSLFITD